MMTTSFYYKISPEPFDRPQVFIVFFFHHFIQKSLRRFMSLNISIIYYSTNSLSLIIKIVFPDVSNMLQNPDGNGNIKLTNQCNIQALWICCRVYLELRLVIRWRFVDSDLSNNLLAVLKGRWLVYCFPGELKWKQIRKRLRVSRRDPDLESDGKTAEQLIPSISLLFARGKSLPFELGDCRDSPYFVALNSLPRFVWCPGIK